MEFIKNIFKNYLGGKATPSETTILDTWYAETGKQATPEWVTSEQLDQAKLEMLRDLSIQLNFPVTDIPQRARFQLSFMRRWLSYAAALIIIVAGGFIYQRLTAPRPVAPKMAMRQVYSTNTGIRKKLVLPDSTIIWLNNGSRLSLSLNDYKNAPVREVWLEEGEAYFTVAKNPERPFIVHVDSLQARVLGTAFNIEAYRQLASTQVLVSHGSVQVSADGMILDTLLRNKQLTFFGKHRFFVVQKITDENGPLWWKSNFVLDDAGFKELVLRLRLKFGVQLYSSNQRILQTSFSAVFPENAPLEKVLAVLCTLYKTSYHRVDKRIIIQ